MFPTHQPPKTSAFFEKPGDCVTTKSLEVFQSLEDGVALAKTIEPKLSSLDELTVLIFDVEQKPFYDKQKIQISKNECARQVGIYKYETRIGIQKTVLVVVITDINLKNEAFNEKKIE